MELPILARKFPEMTECVSYSIRYCRNVIAYALREQQPFNHRGFFTYPLYVVIYCFNFLDSKTISKDTVSSNDIDDVLSEIENTEKVAEKSTSK